MKKKITKLQAYNVMLHYLENIYEKEESEYLGDILSNSEFWPNKLPGDRASWGDWVQAVKKVSLTDKSLNNYNKLTPLQASKAMLIYVQNYVSFYNPKPSYLIDLLKKIELLCNSQKNNKMFQEWLSVIALVIKKEDPRYYLQFIN